GDERAATPRGSRGRTRAVDGIVLSRRTGSLFRLWASHARGRVSLVAGVSLDGRARFPALFERVFDPARAIARVAGEHRIMGAFARQRGTREPRRPPRH